MRLNQILNPTLKSLIVVLVAMGSPWLLQKVWKTLDLVALHEPCMFIYLWLPSTLISVGYLNCYVSYVWLFVIPCIAARQASPSFTMSQNLLKLMSVELVMSSNHLILYHPFSSCTQSFPASGSFPVSKFFASGGQSTGAFSIGPVNIQGQLPLGLTGLISL